MPAKTSFNVELYKTSDYILVDFLQDLIVKVGNKVSA